jgi:hypothetical protein
MQAGSKLSPIEKRGNVDFSKITQSILCFFNSAAAIAPDGPAPMMATWVDCGDSTSAPNQDKNHHFKLRKETKVMMINIYNSYGRIN